MSQALVGLQPPRLTTDFWNDSFAEGGAWEAHDGQRQTRLFAEAFCRHTRLEGGLRGLFLDSSCALGDAMPVLRRRFPHVRLVGFDFSVQAIHRCRQTFGPLASFSARSIEAIEERYDVIYSSATLEHFLDYREKTRHLLRHCRHLCVLVPYGETRYGKDLQYEPEHDHVVTLREDSFDFLLEEGLASRIFPPRLFKVPGAWSWTLRQQVVQTSKNVARALLGRPLARNRDMMLVEMASRQTGELAPPDA